MKAAVCLYGLVGSQQHKGGKGETLDPEIAWGKYRQHIFRHQDCDVFIHTWSTEHEEALRNLYHPTRMLSESQRVFTPEKSHTNIPNSRKQQINRAINLFPISKNLISQSKALKRLLITEPVALRENYIQDALRAKSRWYSNKQTLRLMEEEEVKLGKRYDCVMVSRLDLCFFTDVKFDQYDLSKFWASHWNTAPKPDNQYRVDSINKNLGKGFLDLWFFSNSEFMRSFAALYDVMGNYNPSPHKASYAHVRTFTDQIGYTMYRWTDHELVRRRYYESLE